MEARMPMITTTMRSSMSVNPFLCMSIVVPQRWAGGATSGGGGGALAGGSGGGGGADGRSGGRAVIDGAALGGAQRGVRGGSGPAGGGRGDDHVDTLGVREGERGGGRRVGVVVGVVDLLLGSQVLHVRLHGGEVRLLTRRGELRNGDGRQDSDDDHHDEQLDE